MDDKGQVQSIQYPKGSLSEMACSTIATRKDIYQSKIIWHNIRKRTDKKTTKTYSQLKECYSCTSLHLKVEQNLNIADTPEAVPWDILRPTFRHDCMTSKWFYWQCRKGSPNKKCSERVFNRRLWELEVLHGERQSRWQNRLRDHFTALYTIAHHDATRVVLLSCDGWRVLPVIENLSHTAMRPHVVERELVWLGLNGNVS